MDGEDTGDETFFGPINQFKTRFPALNMLYTFKTSSDDHNRDARCNACSLVYRKCKLSRLIDHAYSCSDCNEEFIQQLRDEEADFKERSQLKSRGGLSKSERANRDKAVAELIAIHSLPLSIVESEEFRKCFQKGRSTEYAPPGRKRLSRSLIPAMAKKMNEDGLRRLHDAGKHSLQLEFDGWSSPGTVSLLAVVITDGQGLSFLVDLVDISAERHTSEYLANLVLEAINKLGLPRNKFNNVVTDEASSYRLARELIVKDFDTRLIEYRCMAHVFNLIGATFSKSSVVKPILTRLSKLIVFLRNKRVAAALENSGSNKVVLTVPTRWYSTTLSINSVLTIKPSLLALPRNEDLAYETWGPILADDEFWSDLISLKKYFDKLAKAIGQAVKIA